MVIPRAENDTEAILFLMMATVARQPHRHLDPALLKGEVLSTVEDDYLLILVCFFVLRGWSLAIACQYRSTDTLLCSLLLVTAALCQ
jgi:hypothetical protein